MARKNEKIQHRSLIFQYGIRGGNPDFLYLKLRLVTGSSFSLRPKFKTIIPFSRFLRASLSKYCGRAFGNEKEFGTEILKFCT